LNLTTVVTLLNIPEVVQQEHADFFKEVADWLAIRLKACTLVNRELYTLQFFAIKRLLNTYPDSLAYENLYQLVVYWYIYDKNDRKYEIIELLEELKFHYLTKNFFIDIVSNDTRLNNIKKLKAYEKIKDKMETTFQYHLASVTRKQDLFPILFSEFISRHFKNSEEYVYTVKLSAVEANKHIKFTPIFFHGLAFIFSYFIEDDKFNCSLTIDKEKSGLKSNFYINQTYQLSALAHPKKAWLLLQHDAITSKEKFLWTINDALKIPWSKVVAGEKGFLKNNVMKLEITITDEDFF